MIYSQMTYAQMIRTDYRHPFSLLIDHGKLIPARFPLTESGPLFRPYMAAAPSVLSRCRLPEGYSQGGQ